MKKLGILLMLLMAMTTGYRVSAQSVTMPLMPGWNWISYPTMDTLDFETAMGSFTPEAGDVIKSRWGQATYINGQWRGTISQFYPGYGYHYKSSRTMPVMLTFNAQQPAPQVIVTTTEPTDITTNSATCGGNVASSDGNYVFVILKGICWSTSPNPTFNDNYVEVGNGIGSFTASMTELNSVTTYYVRAFAVTANGMFYGEQKTLTTLSDVPIGAINGLFTINADGDQVYFSQGNLQYIGSESTPYWKFAENQWDYLGTNTEQNSGDLNVDRDLFAWGTSGWDNGNMYYHPYNTEAQYPQYDNGIGYGPTDGTSYTYNLTDVYANSDWGVYNPILNGGNVSGLWYTLTKNEWQYVLCTRSTTSGIRYAKAIVNGVNGIILLPDNWDTSIYSLNYVNAESASFNTNEITLENWLMLETEGVVFLPAAGMRFGWSLTDAGAGGYYWSTSHDPDYIGDAYSVSFGSSFSYGHYSSLGIYSFYRMLGFSVRLVRDAE